MDAIERALHADIIAFAAGSVPPRCGGRLVRVIRHRSRPVKDKEFEALLAQLGTVSGVRHGAVMEALKSTAANDEADILIPVVG